MKYLISMFSKIYSIYVKIFKYIFKKYSSCLVCVPCMSTRVLQYMLSVAWSPRTREENYPDLKSNDSYFSIICTKNPLFFSRCMLSSWDSLEVILLKIRDIRMVLNRLLILVGPTQDLPRSLELSCFSDRLG